MSLRLRLLLASLVLLVLGLSAAGLVGYRSLSSFLKMRTDAQLEAAVANVRRVVAGLPAGAAITTQQLGAAAPGVWVQVRADEQTPLVEVQGYAWIPKPLTPKLPASLPALSGTTYLGPTATFDAPSTESPDTDFRVMVATTGTGQTLVVGASMQEPETTLRRLVMIELLAGGAILIGATLLGTWLVTLGLRPLARMEAAAETIAEENLGGRLPGEGAKTEVGRFARVLNTMLARLESAFAERRASEARLRRSEERLRRFVADASHELRTPVAAVRAHAELYQRRGERAGDAAPVMAKIEQESIRLTRLVDDLLLLARLDEDTPIAIEPVDVGVLATDAVDAARLIDPGRTVELTIDGSVEVRGDAVRLRQVLDNLLTNVRVHTPARADASVRVGRAGGDAVIEVADRGPGLGDEAQSRIFERFFRADPSRTRDSGGAGLGLSIVAAIVSAHGGTVAASRREGGGMVVSARLPLLAEAT
jgi:two-component system OmpR family sensor kinase